MVRFEAASHRVDRVEPGTCRSMHARSPPGRTRPVDSAVERPGKGRQRPGTAAPATAGPDWRRGTGPLQPNGGARVPGPSGRRRPVRDHRFHDPIATRMLTADERALVERAHDDSPPSAPGERLTWERIRACAEGMVPRTVLIDDALRRAGAGQLVIVGAGLDTRAWRLGELAEVDVYSVDHPATQASLRDQLSRRARQGSRSPRSGTTRSLSINPNRWRRVAARDAARRALGCGAFERGLRVLRSGDSDVCSGVVGLVRHRADDEHDRDVADETCGLRPLGADLVGRRHLHRVGTGDQGARGRAPRCAPSTHRSAGRRPTPDGHRRAGRRAD